MSAKSFSMLAAIVFAVVALAQLARALGVIQVAITIDQTVIPLTASWIAFGVTGALALLGFVSAGR